MPGPKTNEREGTRAVLRYVRVSPYKVRQVIDAIRGKPVHEAADLLRFVERDAAIIVGKLLHSAVANAVQQRRPRPRGAVRFGLLRRRGPDGQALAPPGPGPGHPDPEAFEPRDYHRQPAARRAPGPAAGAPAGREPGHAATPGRGHPPGPGRGRRRRPEPPGAPPPRDDPGRRGRADCRRGVGDGARDRGDDVSRSRPSSARWTTKRRPATRRPARRLRRAAETEAAADTEPAVAAAAPEPEAETK